MLRTGSTRLPEHLALASGVRAPPQTPRDIRAENREREGERAIIVSSRADRQSHRFYTLRSRSSAAQRKEKNVPRIHFPENIKNSYSVFLSFIFVILLVLHTSTRKKQLRKIIYSHFYTYFYDIFISIRERNSRKAAHTVRL